MDYVNTLRKSLQNAMKDMVFRRVEKVFTDNLTGVFYTEPLVQPPWEKRRTITLKEESNISDSEKIKRVYREYNDYRGYTTSRNLRSNDTYKGNIKFNMKNYSQFDIRKLQFTGGYKSRTPPKEPEFEKRKVKVIGDLICGLVEYSVDGTPYYTNWFICSEQFFRLWTLIMYNNHDSFKIYGKDKMRERILSGNKLNTNSYLKWVLGCTQNSVNVTEKELEDKFYVQRTEYISKSYVHIYTSLALLIRFQEYPTSNNVPNNMDNSPKLQVWSLPPNFLQNLILKTTNVHVEWSIPQYIGHKSKAIDIVPNIEKEKITPPNIDSKKEFPDIRGTTIKIDSKDTSVKVKISTPSTITIRCTRPETKITIDSFNWYESVINNEEMDYDSFLPPKYDIVQDLCNKLSELN